MDFSNYSEEIYSAGLFFYRDAKDEYDTTEFVATLKDSVDEKILRGAADAACGRFPFLMVEVKKDGRDLRLVHNCRPLAVIGTDEKITLASQETNFHLLAITFHENRISFHAFHGLVDGRGAMPFRATVLYYYCKEKYGGGLAAPDAARLAGTEIREEEYKDPFTGGNCPRVNPAAAALARLLLLLPVPKSYSILASENFSKKPCHFVLKVSEDSFMELCRKNGSSPVAMASLLLFMAIEKKRGAKDRAVNINVPCDLRKVLGVSMSHHTSLTGIVLRYSGKLKSMSFGEQAAAIRKTLKEKSGVSALELSVKILVAIFDKLKSLKTILEKQSYVKKITGENSLVVSYSGKSKWGDMERYIESVYVNVAGKTASDICIEINAVSGNFFFNFLQLFEEDKFFKAFCDELKTHGVEYELICHGENKCAGVEL